MFGNNFASTNFDYFHGGASGGGRPPPILEPENAKFFIVLASTQTDLAISTVSGEWYVQLKHATMLNESYNRGKTQVMIFFTVSDSRHIQGAALMTSEAVDQGEGVLREDYANNTPVELRFTHRFTLEWYRTTEFPTATALEAAEDLFLPTSKTELCQDMSSKTGESLMKALWNSPLVTLYESWSQDDDREPPAPEALLTDFRCPPPDEVAWPVLPGPDFILVALVIPWMSVWEEGFWGFLRI